MLLNDDLEKDVDGNSYDKHFCVGFKVVHITLQQFAGTESNSGSLDYETG
jgi:hypothetical protein